MVRRRRFRGLDVTREERERQESLKEAESGKVELGFSKPPSLHIRWGFGPVLSLVLWLLWLLGMFLPLTVLIPIGLQQSSASLQTAGAIMLVLFGFLGANLFFVGQAATAASVFDIEEQDRYAKVEKLVQGMLQTAGTSESERFRTVLENILRKHLNAKKRRTLSKLWIVKLCGSSSRGRFLCWRSEIITLVLGFAFIVIPLCVMLPIAYSQKEHYQWSGAQTQVVMALLLAIFLCVYVARKIDLLLNLRREGVKAYWKRTVTAAKSQQSLLRSKGLFSQSAVKVDDPQRGGEDTGNARSGGKTLVQMVETMVNCIPGWLLWELFELWFLVVFPLAFFLSYIAYLQNQTTTELPLEFDTLSRRLKGAAFLLLTIFVELGLLVWSLSRRTNLQFKEEDMVKYTEEEIAVLSLCKRNNWPLSQLGDYPYFSIGEGVITRGIQYHGSNPWTILVRRLYVNLVVLVVLPLVLLVSLVNRVQADLLAIFLVIIVIGPVLFFVFYASKMIWDVTPRRRKNGVLWIAVWVASCFLLPLGVGIYLVVASTDSSVLTGGFMLSFPLAEFLLSLLWWLRNEWTALKQWYSSLTVEKPWLIEVSSTLWKIAFGFVVALDFIGIISVATGQRIQLKKLAILLVTVSLVANMFLFIFVLFSITAGVARSTSGIVRVPPFLSTLLRWLVFATALVEVSSNTQESTGRFSAVFSAGPSFRLFTVTSLTLALVLVLLHAFFLRKEYLLKEKYGYFPDDWERAEPKPRGVREEASQVISYPTEWIEEDLCRRQLIPPNARELLAQYLDPSLSERDRLSVKNRLVLVCTTPAPSREELERRLEHAISDDLDNIEALQEKLRLRRSREVFVAHDKDNVVRLKFEGEMAHEMVRILERTEEDADKADVKLAAVKAEEKLNEGKKSINAERVDDLSGLDVASDSESDDSSVTSTSSEESVHETAEFISIPKYFENHPRIHAFDVARVDRLTDHVYIPKSKLYLFGKDLPYKRINTLLVLDGNTGNLLLTGYRVWEVSRIPLAWISSIEWSPVTTDEQSRLGVKLFVEEPSSTGCFSSHVNRKRQYNLFFRTNELRDKFCLAVYKMTCVSGVTVKTPDGSVDTVYFVFNEDGKIYRDVSAKQKGDDQGIELSNFLQSATTR